MRVEHVHVIHLSVVRRDGEAADAIFCVVSTPDEVAIAKWCERLEVKHEIDISAAPLLADDGLRAIGEWIARVTDADPAPVIERDPIDVLRDEMTRNQRNTERHLRELAALVERAMDATHVERALNREMASAVPPGVPAPVFRIQRERAPLPEARRLVTGPKTLETLERLQREQPRDAYTNEEIEASLDPAAVDWNALREEPRARATLRRDGRARTAEMGEDDVKSALGNAPNQGNMRLAGPAAASEVMEVQITADGSAEIVKGSLPKVGDTLRPYGQRG